MILIDRDKAEQKFALTLGGVNPFYILMLKNDATRKEFRLDIDRVFVNSRYDLFVLDTDIFNGMPEGYYAYNIRGVILMGEFSLVFDEPFGSRNYTEVIECGKLYIKPSAAEPTPSVINLSNEILVFTKQ